MYTRQALGLYVDTKRKMMPCHKHLTNDKKGKHVLVIKRYALYDGLACKIKTTKLFFLEMNLHALQI